MLKYILKRLLMFIPVVLGVLFVTFTINYFSPGDAAIATLGSEASQEALESFREENGLNDPFLSSFTTTQKASLHVSISAHLTRPSSPSPPSF